MPDNSKDIPNRGKEDEWSLTSGTFQPQIGSWGVVQLVDAEEKGFCWYYKDYAEAKKTITCK